MHIHGGQNIFISSFIQTYEIWFVLVSYYILLVLGQWSANSSCHWSSPQTGSWQITIWTSFFWSHVEYWLGSQDRMASTPNSSFGGFLDTSSSQGLPLCCRSEYRIHHVGFPLHYEIPHNWWGSMWVLRFHMGCGVPCGCWIQCEWWDSLWLVGFHVGGEVPCWC